MQTLEHLMMNDRGVFYPLSGEISVFPIKGRELISLARQSGINLRAYKPIGISLGMHKVYGVTFYVLCTAAGRSPRRGNSVISITAVRIPTDLAKLLKRMEKWKVTILNSRLSKKHYRIDRVVIGGEQTWLG